MLNPIVYCKVVRARNAYLKAGRIQRPVARDLLLEIAGDRHDLYKLHGRPKDAKMILKLATTKRNATPAELALLEKARREICLLENGMG